MKTINRIYSIYPFYTIKYICQVQLFTTYRRIGIHNIQILTNSIPKYKNDHAHYIAETIQKERKKKTKLDVLVAFYCILYSNEFSIAVISFVVCC